MCFVANVRVNEKLVGSIDEVLNSCGSLDGSMNDLDEDKPYELRNLIN